MPTFKEMLANVSNVIDVTWDPGHDVRSDPARPFMPVGVMLHHTAGVDSLGIVRSGRTGLPGPLSHFLVRKTGEVIVVAEGYCNSAGWGTQEALDRVRNEQPPRLATANGTVSGNSLFYAIEVENLGDNKDPYPEAQLDATAAIAAALLWHNGWGVNRAIHHKEWTNRKIDMSTAAGDMRARIEDWLFIIEIGETMATFTDITGNTHEEAIEKLARVGIASGYADGTFRPKDPVTRGQLASFLVRGLDYGAAAAGVTLDWGE